jgi:error-prone DNA polymerase
MPDIEHQKHRRFVELPPRSRAGVVPPYAELQVTSNFSFLRGGSHPDELVMRAAELGYQALALTDLNTVAGIVRAYGAAKESSLHFVVGSRLELSYEPIFKQPSIPASKTLFPEPRSPQTLSSQTRASQITAPQCSVLVYPTSRRGYGNLCRLLTVGKRRSSAGSCSLTFGDLFQFQDDLFVTLVPPSSAHRLLQSPQEHDLECLRWGQLLLEGLSDHRKLSIALTRNYSHNNIRQSAAIQQLADSLHLPLVATNDVHYHHAARRPLQDVLTCIRSHCTIQDAGFKLFHNAERHLKTPDEMARLFRDLPQALRRGIEIAESCRGFSLSQLRYEYPREIAPDGTTPEEYLRLLTQQGAAGRYPEGVPDKVKVLLEEELSLIRELDYEKYFLTCHDIVRHARELGILCQGRGAAANSAVCYCLGITSVNPATSDMLFARFISKERNEPPDIDIDFEHERREEVIQYLYERYGRDRAGLTCEVVTYRARSATRDVGKALGLSLPIVEALTKSIHRWTNYGIPLEALQEAGLDPNDQTIRNTVLLAQELLGFPRHLSQHVGGFIITQERLTETVPILNASMPDRTIIEWDKDDIETLGMLKIDILALGMLTCIRKALLAIEPRAGRSISLAEIPTDDPAVYRMITAADTVGVFQIESRAQMSMLPRLRPHCFYDLVVQVAIVRPGPIQGNMVHPYLRRRAGHEVMTFPDERVRAILGKTFGVPIFQEQAMRLAIVLAEFSPGEAEQLRRAMSAWKRNKGLIQKFQERVVRGMIQNGYSQTFAETCMNQIKGFSEYGFPESHAASFALLAYASAWLKCHYPVEFAMALLNSQPMGFYAPAQIITDLKRHGGVVNPIDINRSRWDCSLETSPEKAGTTPQLRLGLRLVHGIGENQGRVLDEILHEYRPFRSIQELWSRIQEQAPYLRRALLEAIARADGFQSLGLGRRDALWMIQELKEQERPIERMIHQAKEARLKKGPTLPAPSRQQSMFDDYRATGFSLNAHPIGLIRDTLTGRGVVTASSLLGKGRDVSLEYSSPRGFNRAKADSEVLQVSVAGIAIVRQRPGTARGTVFLTLEDETGVVNLIIRPTIFEQFNRIIIGSSALLARGSFERLGEVLYLQAHHLESLDAVMLREHQSSGGYRNYNGDTLPNKSYSY